MRPSRMSGSVARSAGAMRHQDRAQPAGQVRQYQEHSQGVVGQQPNVPGVMQNTHRRPGRPTPVGFNAEMPCQHKYRVHMRGQIDGEVDAGGALKRAQQVGSFASLGLPEHQTRQQLKCQQHQARGLNPAVSINLPQGVHHRDVGCGALQGHEMVEQVSGDEAHPEQCGDYAMRVPQPSRACGWLGRRGRGFGVERQVAKDCPDADDGAERNPNAGIRTRDFHQIQDYPHQGEGGRCRHHDQGESKKQYRPAGWLRHATECHAHAEAGDGDDIGADKGEQRA